MSEPTIDPCDTIGLLRAELASVRDEAKAAVAAALEKAAQDADDFCQFECSTGDPRGTVGHDIRALITPDHRAALDSLLAAARREQDLKWWDVLTKPANQTLGLMSTFTSIVQEHTDSLLAKAKMEALEEAVRVMRDALTTDMATGAADYSEAEERANQLVRPLVELMERK